MGDFGIFLCGMLIFFCHEDIEVDDETGGACVHSRSNVYPWARNCRKKLRWLKSKCAVWVPHFQISLWIGEAVAGRANVRDFSSYVGQIIVWEPWWRHRCASTHIHLYRHTEAILQCHDTAFRKKANIYHFAYKISKQNLIISFMQNLITVNTLSATIIRDRDD